MEAVYTSCEDIYLTDELSSGSGTSPCWPRCVMIILAQHVLLFTFLVLLKSAEHLSDAYGFKASCSHPAQQSQLLLRKLYFEDSLAVL